MGSEKINSRPWSPADLRQQVLYIEEQVSFDTPISPLQRNKLFRQLDRTRRSMEAICDSSKPTNEFSRLQIERDLDDLPEKITKLYGQIHNRSVDTQVRQVVDKAKSLQDRLDHGDCDNIVKEVSGLKKRLQQIRRRHALGSENLKIARYVSTRAEQFLRAHALGQPIPPLVNQLNLLEIQRLHYRDAGNEDEVIIELFELAESFYFGHNRDTLKRFNLLPEAVRRRIQAHFAILGVSSPQEDRVKTAQTLVATAYDLAHGEGSETYFSLQELEKLFSEARASATT